MMGKVKCKSTQAQDGYKLYEFSNETLTEMLIEGYKAELERQADTIDEQKKQIAIYKNIIKQIDDAIDVFNAKELPDRYLVNQLFKIFNSSRINDIMHEPD